MELLLPKGVVTWRARGHESAIDLIFATASIADAVHKCQIALDLQHGSDHLPILTEFGLFIEAASETPRRAWKTAKPERVEEEAAKLAQLLPLRPLEKEDSIDEYVEELFQGIAGIVDAAVPWAKPPVRAKSFWNQDCDKATKEAKTLASYYRNNRDSRAEQEWHAGRKRRDKVLRKAKALHFRDGVHKASQSPQGVWKLAKWARDESTKPRPLPQFPPLKDRDNKIQSTFDGKVAVLRNAFFPPPPQAELGDIADKIYPEPRTMNSDLTQKEVLYAIFRPKPDKAPGIDGIPSRFLRMIASKLLSHFTHLFQACLNKGYHPKEFKKANTIVLKKPKKEDYSSAKSYRPIALLSILGKTLETIIIKRLNDCAEDNNLLLLE